MPVVQPVLGTVTNTHTHTYIYMITVGKSMPIDNYEQYKRVINQITGRLYMHITVYTHYKSKKNYYFFIDFFFFLEREREREREIEREREREREY